MKKKKLLTLALLLQFVITLGFGSAIAYAATHDRAPTGLIVWGQDLSGLNRNQAFERLKKSIPKAVSYQGIVYPLKMDRSYADIDSWLDRIFPSTTGSYLRDALQVLARSAFVPLPDNQGLNKDDIISQLQSISRIVNRPMRSFSIAYKDGRLEKTDGQIGQELDIEGTWQKIIQMTEQKPVPLLVNAVPAQPNEVDISMVQSILGDYTTYFNSQDVSRTNNVRLAAKALNNRLIAPGQVFSFNNVVGERTEAVGYLPAYVFADQSVIKGEGGGICQDSSTLFQTVRQAHLTIVERHTHTLPVTYVLKGQDATVSYGILDFRFKNDTKGYLLISARTGTNWLRIQLYGLASDQHPILLNPDGYPMHPYDLRSDPK